MIYRCQDYGGQVYRAILRVREPLRSNILPSSPPFSGFIMDKDRAISFSSYTIKRNGCGRSEQQGIAPVATYLGN